jgi:hypothetical protein
VEKSAPLKWHKSRPLESRYGLAGSLKRQMDNHLLDAEPDVLRERYCASFVEFSHGLGDICDVSMDMIGCSGLVKTFVFKL